MRSHRFQIGFTLLYAVLFGAIYGGTNWLSARRDPPTAPHFAFETAIPFVPAMAWFYLSVPLMLGVGPLIMRTRRELLPFFFTLTAQLVVAGARVRLAGCCSGRGSWRQRPRRCCSTSIIFSTWPPAPPSAS